jgi:nitrogen fixation protein FixH
MSVAEPRPRFVINGWHVLIGLVLFFAADIAVNTVFMVSAYRTFPGQTEVTPYEDGLVYNSALKQLLEQQALGWRFTAAATGGAVRIEAFDRSGRPITGLHATGLLRRPATEAGRRDLTFHETAPGVYVSAGPPAGGAWDLDLTAVDAQGRRAVAERRLVLP